MENKKDGLILFYDTETTGFPSGKKPLNDEAQPHLVQLAAILADTDTEKVVSSFDVTIKPEGWEIGERVAAIHGVTNDMALRVGVPEDIAFHMFSDLCSLAGTVVAHNAAFDQKLIDIAAHRYGTETQIKALKNKSHHQCTMEMSRPICMIPYANGRVGIKNPKLTEAYHHLTGEILKNAHTALADARACMRIYFLLVNMDGLKIGLNDADG